MRTLNARDQGFWGRSVATGGGGGYTPTQYRGPISASNYFSQTTVATFAYPKSLSVWVNPIAFGSIMIPISLSRETRLYDYLCPRVLASGNVQAIHQKNGTQAFTAESGPLSLGVWQHIGVMMSSSQLKLYVGGVLIDSVAHVIGTSNWHYAIGARNGGTGIWNVEPFNGLIADPAWWNAALTDSNFANLAAGHAPNSIAGLAEHTTMGTPLTSSGSLSWTMVGTIP